MIDLKAEDLIIEVDEQTPGRLVVTWRGRSNSRNPGALLHPWFDQLFTTAKERGTLLEMRFEKLEHFNSSTIAVLIQLINSARDRGLGLSIHYDGTLRWQALSFEALKRALRMFEQGGGPAELSFKSV
jgi:hypothetical protein